MLGLCLVAAFTLGALTATSASAKLPEWGGCEAKTKAKYYDAACTVALSKSAQKTQGRYEWYTGANFAEGRGLNKSNVSPVDISPTTFETSNGRKIGCADSEESGEGLSGFQLEAPNQVKRVLLNFTQCHESAEPPEEGKACHSPAVGGIEPGGEELISDAPQWEEGEAIKGTLVYVTGKGTSTPTVGLSLAPFRTTKQRKEEGFPPEPLFTVVCQGPMGTLEVGGTNKGGNAVISLISPIDQPVGEGEAFTQVFAQSGGIQDPAKPEKGGDKTLRTEFQNLWEPMGLSATFRDVVENRFPVEIKAIP